MTVHKEMLINQGTGGHRYQTLGRFPKLTLVQRAFPDPFPRAGVTHPHIHLHAHLHTHPHTHLPARSHASLPACVVVCTSVSRWPRRQWRCNSLAATATATQWHGSSGGDSNCDGAGSGLATATEMAAADWIVSSLPCRVIFLFMRARCCKAIY